MDKTSTTRKNLTNLSSPLEVRELNRQLEWVWRKILGGLTIKDFSDAGTKSVVTTVEKTVAEEIKADSVTTNVLKAALAEMMASQIGVANINYAQIVDLYSNSIFTDSELAGKIRAENLEVTSAQIVDLVVNSFRLVQDGKVYKVSVDSSGNLQTEYASDEDAMFAGGEIPDGYSAVASSLSVGEVSSGQLYVKGAADIMKLTAKYLSADAAFINELVSNTLFTTYLMANQAFLDKLYVGTIYGGKSIEMYFNEVDSVKTQSFIASADPPAAADVYDGYRWLDTGVSPNQMRMWKDGSKAPSGADASTAREYEETVNGVKPTADDTTWTPSQEGSGDPSLTNIRPIVAKKYAYLKDSEGNIVKLTFPEPIYGGTISADGNCTKTWGIQLLDGTEAWHTSTSAKLGYWVYPKIDMYTAKANAINEIVCDRFKSGTYDQYIAGDIIVSHDTSFCFSPGFATLAEWKAYLAEQYAAGTPVQVAYVLRSPVSFTATVETVLENTHCEIDNSAEQITSSISVEISDSALSEATISYGSLSQTVPLDADSHTASITLEPQVGKAFIATDAAALTVQYHCSGWKVINDTSAVEQAANKAVAQVQVKYAISASATTAPTTGWQATMPERSGKDYIWQKTVTTFNSGQTEESAPTCISGVNGEDATLLRIDSSRGTVFKNNAVSTVLSAVIYRGGERITDIDTLHSIFGSGAYIQWSWQRMDENRFGVISSSDSRIGDGGFTFTLSPDDVDTKVTFMCELIV